MVEVMRESHFAPRVWRRGSWWLAGAMCLGEANFRVVWGWNRLAWIGGKFEDRDEHGRLIREVVELRQEPKYPAVNRWHMEKWMPAETYGSPRNWVRAND